MGSELLKIADGFSMVAEGLRGLAGMEKNSGTEGKNTAQEQADTEKAKKPDKKNTADDKKEKPVAVEDIRAVMAQKSQEGKTKEIRELLQKFGAVKLSAVKTRTTRLFCRKRRCCDGETCVIVCFFL